MDVVRRRKTVLQFFASANDDFEASSPQQTPRTQFKRTQLNSSTHHPTYRATAAHDTVKLWEALPNGMDAGIGLW